MDISYGQLYKMNKEEARREIIDSYLATGSISGVACLLEERYYRPLVAHLARIPKGRKGYNGRVERSHRSDDEDILRPIWSGHTRSGGLEYLY